MTGSSKSAKKTSKQNRPNSKRRSPNVARKKAKKETKKRTRKRKTIDPLDESQWGKPPQKYNHDFEMIKNNIYPEGTKQPKHSSEQCGCEPKEEGVMGCTDESCQLRMMFVECNPKLCAVGKLCTNARLQRRQFAAVKPVWRGPKGWGLFLMEDLKKGDLILEYCGDVISKKQKAQRLKEGKKTKKFYLMSLNATETIDGTEHGNLSRFINHSCDPNSETQKWRVNGRERIGLFALKGLPKKTELSYDYFGGNFSTDQQQFFGSMKQICYCASNNCGGYLGVRPKALEKDDAPKGKKDNTKRQKKKKASGNIDDDRLSRYVSGVFELKKKKQMKSSEESEGNPPYLERTLAKAKAPRMRWLSKICDEHQVTDYLQQVASSAATACKENSDSETDDQESNSTGNDN